MFPQSTIFSKLSMTNATFEWFLSFMDCYNMCIQMLFMSKCDVTNITKHLPNAPLTFVTNKYGRLGKCA